MLHLDLQFFADGEEDTFDLDQFQQEFEAEWNETDETVDEEVSEPETEDSENPSENAGEEEPETEQPEQEDEEQSEPKESANVDDEQKRNRAFADLRRQAEENKKYAEFVNQIAEQNGISPEEVLQRFEERRIEQEAEKQNVPVDVYKRLNSLEQENKRIKEQTKAEQFDNQVRSTIDKHGLKEDDVNKVFQYMADNGYAKPNDLPSISFEDAYFLANKDSIVEQRVQEARQKDLTEKQKRQQSSALPSGNSVSQTEEITDDFIDKELERMGIRID